MGEPYPIIVIPSNHFMAHSNSLSDRCIAQPRLHHDIFTQREVPFQKHLLPYHRCHTRSAYIAVVEIDELLHQGLKDGGIIRPHGIVEKIGVQVDFIASGVEVCAVGCHSREQVFPKGIQESIHGGRIELQASAGRLIGVGAPIWLDVVGSDEFRGTVGDGSRVAGRVDFDVDFHTPVHAVFLDLGELLASVR